MAKRSGVNKSAAVRDYLLAGHLDAGPKEVIEALKANGVKVTTGLVSNVKTNLKKKQEDGGTVTATAPRTRKSKSPAPVNGSVTLADASRLVEVSKSFGGFDGLRAALAQIESLNAS